MSPFAALPYETATRGTMEVALTPVSTRHSLPPDASRIVGQGRILRALRTLVRRVERFAAHRARTCDEQQWAAQMADALERTLSVGLESSAARHGLASVDARAAVRRKGKVMTTMKTKPSEREGEGGRNLHS